MRRVLVVDDELDLLRTIASVLQDEGYAVRTAGHGAEALELVAQEVPDVIVADVMMPYLSGFELTKRLREELGSAAPPVVLMSAVPPGVPRAEYGWRAFLQKPFTIDDLLDAVAEAVSGR